MSRLHQLIKHRRKALGLGLQVMLIPEDKVSDVQAIVDDQKQLIQAPGTSQEHKDEKPAPRTPGRG